MAFKLNRPDGSVAIDANYFNLGLRQSGSLVLSNTPNPNVPASKNGSITVSTDQAIIAYRASHPTALVVGKVSGGQTTFTFLGVNANGNISVDWWLFDLPEYAMSFSSAGKMIARRPQDGRVAFDSRKKYLKVLDFFAGVSGDLQKSYAKLPAVVMVNRAWGMSAQTMPGAQNQVQVINQSSMSWVGADRSIVVGGRQTLVAWQPSGSPTYAYSGGTPQYMIVDVENY
jgi:hypothetical protein